MFKLKVENMVVETTMKTIDETPMEAELIVGISYLLSKYKEGLVEKGLTDTMAEERLNHVLHAITEQSKMIHKDTTEGEMAKYERKPLKHLS